MSIDVFNNTSNDYINTELARCAGDADTSFFEFLSNRKVGIISGTDTLVELNLADVYQEVIAWVKQIQYVQPGEVVFIQGLTKGISKSKQLFNLEPNIFSDDLKQPFYLTIDLSINYYKNFRYHEENIHAVSDITNNIDIETALNLELNDKGINISSTYISRTDDDAPDVLEFNSMTPGYNFNISNITAKQMIPDTPIVTGMLSEDTSSYIPAFKYSNSAMLGYVLKVEYPDKQHDSNLFIHVNNVSDKITYYEESLTQPNLYEKHTKKLDVGMNGDSTSDTMSAADYLDYVNTNKLWSKVGAVKAHISAIDPIESNVKNLLTGMYVFNPQTFPVKIEYLTFI